MARGDSPSFTVEQIRNGICLLREVLPASKAQALANVGIGTMSALAKAVRPYLREDNLKAMIVYQTPLGGWIADVLLKNVPPGVSNVMGTPTRYPLKTRAEAIEQGTAIISFILAAKDAEGAAESGPVFFYYDTIFPLYPDLLAILQSQQARYASLDDAYARLKDITIAIFGRRRPSYATITALTGADQKRLASIFHMSVMTGVMRYPPFELGMPGDRVEDDECATQIDLTN